jgi:hypothetical protein
MNKILATLAFLILSAMPAMADYVVKDANGNVITIKSGTVGGNVLPWMSPVDATGTAYGTVGNPFAVAPGTGASFPVTGTFWQATQPVSAASLPLPAGAATSALQNSTITALGSPFQAGGSIGNTSFGISGTLPAFAATPTFNCGTGCFQTTQPISGTVTAAQATAANLNATVVGTGTFAAQLTGATNNINNISGTISLPTGAATQTTLASVLTALGSPFQAGGSIGNTTFAATQSGTWNIGSITTLPALVAGSAIIGKVGIDQTTVGTTNGVSLAQIGANTVSTGAGATGTGTQRVGIAQDTTTIGGAAPGTAGAASANVVTVQGVASMTPVAISGASSNASSGVATSSTNVPTVAYNYGFNGTTWDPAKSKAASTQAAFSDTALVADPRPNSAATISGTATNPTTGAYTLTSTTTAYTAGQLIANNSAAGSVTNPSFSIANSAGGAAIPRLRLISNDTTSTAWAAQTVQVDLWSAAPTWTNGDRAAWLPATGSASHLGSYNCTFPTPVWGDGLTAECAPQVGNFSLPVLASGSTVYASYKAVTGSGVTGASKTFTLIAEEMN